MAVKSAAQRFYEAAHASHSKGEPFVDLMPGDRYFAVLDIIRSQPGKILCELGFGGVSRLNLLAKFCQEYHVVDIVDCSAGSVLPENVRAYCSNLDDPFPFEDAQFDIVVALMVVEHLYDPFHAMNEIARICRPGGIVIVNLPNIAALKCRISLLFGKLPVTSVENWFEKRQWDGNHLHYFTFADTIRLAELYGLQLEIIYPVGRFLWLKRLLPRLFCHEISYIFRKAPVVA